MSAFDPLRTLTLIAKVRVDMDDHAKNLNDAAVLPPHAYRRNHRHYELVCYVNCLVGCRIGGNTEGAALFVDRVKQFMTDHPPTPDVARYYEVVAEYVSSKH